MTYCYPHSRISGIIKEWMILNDKQEQISNPYAFILGQITLDCVNGEVEKNMD